MYLSIRISVNGLSVFKLKLEYYQSTFFLLPKNTNFYLILLWKIKLHVLDLGNYSCLKVDLIFTRDRSFYFTTVFIPGIILVTSSFITFWLEWNAVPARVMIGEST